MNELWTLLWSQSQACFHIEELSETVKAGQNAFIADRQMDYVPVFVGSREECDRMASQLRPALDRRSASKDMARDAIRKASER